jgi:carbon-monoxide dehydrogenase large subunit
LGLGIAGFIEGTGIGPYEGANVRLAEDGSIVVATGAASQGQGHETSFSQICAEVFDIDVDQIVIKEGDTALIERGIGTFASRSAVVAGSAIYEASLQLKSKLLQFVSTHFHLKQDGLFYEKGAVYSHEDPFFKQSLAEIANLALSEGLLDQLQVVHYFSPETVTYTSGFHAAMVKVDIDTGRVDLLDYYVVHDAGVEINPMIVEGQLYGGLLQGIGGALLEELVYSEKGELVSATLKEYKLPNIYNMPKITLIKEEYPSTRNPLGLKGTGEGGAICPQAAIANAVADALLPFNVKVNQLPLTPQIVHGLISQKREHTGKVEPVYR